MASIEITPPLVAMALTWLSSTAALAWTLSRRSKSWDEVGEKVERHQKLLYGDPDKLDHGVVLRVHDVETSAKGFEREVQTLKKSLNAYGADEAAVVDSVHRYLVAVSVKAYHDDMEARRKIIASEQPDPFGTTRKR